MSVKRGSVFFLQEAHTSRPLKALIFASNSTVFSLQALSYDTLLQELLLALRLLQAISLKGQQCEILL